MMNQKWMRILSVSLAVCVAAGGMFFYVRKDTAGEQAYTVAGQAKGFLEKHNVFRNGPDDVADADVYEKLEQTIQNQDGDPVYDGYVVCLKQPVSEGVTEKLDDAIASGAHLTKIEYLEGGYTAEDLDEIRDLIDISEIDYIEPDYQVKMLEGTPASAIAPNDKYYEAYQYNITDLNIPPVWEYGMEGQDFDDVTDMDYNGSADDDDIIVAVIDSGLKDGHEDIDWSRVVSGISFADGTTEDDTNDTDGHGTFVTGIIAAQKDNEVGTAGILQKVKVMPIRVFNGETASDSVIVNAINYAAQQKEEFDASKGTAGTNISVINMSLGSSGTSASMDAACRRVMEDGILVVCAAGNDGNTAASYPAQYSMGVGSTNNTKTVSSYSQRLSANNGSTYANKVWVTAPGEKVTSLYCENTKSYAQMSGTSFSSPEVAALGAVCKSLKNDIAQEEFMQLLKDTAVYKTGSSGDINGQDVEYGWGLVDFKRTADRLITEQFGEQTGASVLTVHVQNEAGSQIADPFVRIYELQINADGSEEKGEEIAPNDDGTWTLQKGRRYYYAAHAEKYDYQENTFATLTDARTLTITLQGKSYPVTFRLVNSSGKAVEPSSLTVRSVAGKVHDMTEDGSFLLRNGTYQYSLEAEGYFDTTGSFVIDDIRDDLDNGYVVDVVLRGDEDVCSLKLRVTGDSEDGDITGKSVIELLDEDGNEISIYKDGCYKLEAGTYSYTVYHDAYKSVSGQITISARDIGSSMVQNIVMNGKLYTVTLHIFPLSADPEVLIYDDRAEIYERQTGTRKVDTRNYRLTDGTYYFRITDAERGTYTGSFLLADGQMTTNGLSIAGVPIITKSGTRDLEIHMQENSAGTIFADNSAVPDPEELQPVDTPEPPAEHVHKYYSEVTKEPTCTETGIRTWTCEAGDDSYTEEIPKLPHQFDENGICTVCGTKESDTIEDEDWLTLNWVADDGTVTERKLALSQLLQYQTVKNYTMINSYFGTSTSYTVYGITFRDLFEQFGGASRCVTSVHIDAMDIPDNKDSYGNLYYVELEQEQLDNAMIAWYTVNQSSGEERTGSDENNMRVVIDNGMSSDWMYGPDVAAIRFGTHEHQAGETVAPTCTEDGYTEYVCSKCGSTYRDDITPATGHRFDPEKDVVTEPTCTTKGYTTHVCEVCGETVVDSYTAIGHSWGDWTVTKPASLIADGEMTHVCEVCGLEETETIPKLDRANPYRIFGENRYDTSAGIAGAILAANGGMKFDAVVLTTGNNYADALSGSYLSKVKNAPILIINPGSAEQIRQTADYIRENMKADGTVYILGGVSAVPSLAETYLSNYPVKRLGGADRYETNLMILREAGVTDGQDLLVCTGTNFADSLSASATGKPILLVGQALNGQQAAWLNSIAKSDMTIIGGTSAVSAVVETQLGAYAKNIARLSGADRYETSVLVAKRFFERPEEAVLTVGTNYPDGLCGSSLAMTEGCPLLLASDTAYQKAETYCKEAGIHYGYVLGGTGLISDRAAKAILEIK